MHSIKKHIARLLLFVLLIGAIDNHSIVANAVDWTGRIPTEIEIGKTYSDRISENDSDGNVSYKTYHFSISEQKYIKWTVETQIKSFVNGDVNYVYAFYKDSISENNMKYLGPINVCHKSDNGMYYGSEWVRLDPGDYLFVVQVGGCKAADYSITLTYMNQEEELISEQVKKWELMNKYVDEKYILQNWENDIQQMTQKEKDELKTEAEKTTAGCNTDYERIKAIGYYVANNIYYDFDNYIHGMETFTEPYEVYKNKRSVCDGYSNLVRAMLSLIDIPCMKLTGFDHAYNAAYDSERKRWVFLEATWGTGNSYEYGEWSEGQANLDKFFDLSPKEIALLGRHETYEITGVTDGTDKTCYYTFSNYFYGEYSPVAPNRSVPIMDNYNGYLKLVGFKNEEARIVDKIGGYTLSADKLDVGTIEGAEKIKKMILPEGVEEISFYGCKNLTSVSFPSTLNKIPTQGFADCPITKADMSKTKITMIEMETFSGCKKLKEVKLSPDTAYIFVDAFSGCKNLKKVALNGDNLKIVGYGAFGGSKKNVTFSITAKNKKNYKKAVNKIKKSGVKKAKYVWINK